MLRLVTRSKVQGLETTSVHPTENPSNIQVPFHKDLWLWRGF